MNTLGTARIGVLVMACGIGGCSSNPTSSGDAGLDGSSLGDGSNPVDGAKPDGTSGDSGTGSDAAVGPNDFPASSTIYQDISGAGLDSEWPAIQTALNQSGWGNAFQLDPSFTVLYADGSVARRAFTQPSGALPDCDTAPIPVPAGGRIEGYPDYFCSNSGDDCHMLVYQASRLYELYQASITGGQATGGTFSGSCLVVWDLTHDYWQNTTPFSRGDGCNGADAADVPMAPLLLKKDEIAAGQIKHAMRFTISNSLIRKSVYVHPATHLGGPTGGATTMPYGSRLRLRANYPLASLPSDAARAIATALQKYGMFLDDGGGFYVSGTTDITDVIDTHDLKALLPSDFEMLDGGTRYNFSQQNCTRTPITN